MTPSFIVKIKQGPVEKIVQYTVSKFPAGELNIQINQEQFSSQFYLFEKEFDKLIITGRLSTSDSIVELLLLKDALDRTPFKYFERILSIGYLPYGRQDRVCNQGEAFSLKVISNLINSLDFTKVQLMDVHSNVSLALIDNSSEITQSELVSKMLKDGDFGIQIDYLCAPDLGATKKVFESSEKVQIPMIHATKIRDLKTGKIIKSEVLDNIDYKDKNILIIDDICDGGATLIGVAKSLKEKGVKSVFAYVTHGIFSKGKDHLLSNGIDRIFTTDSCLQKKEDIEII